MTRAVNDSANERIVVILGNADRAEMRPLANAVNRLVSRSARQIFCREVEALFSQLAAGEFPDLIVVLQGWPDEFSCRDVNQLLGYAPLARVVVCYGAWCESDGRNRDIWPLSVRVPLCAAESRIHREWHLIQNPGLLNPIPWSASREEIFAADHPPVEKLLETESMLVDSPDPEYRKFLHEMLTAIGGYVMQSSATVIDLCQPSEGNLTPRPGLAGRGWVRGEPQQKPPQPISPHQSVGKGDGNSTFEETHREHDRGREHDGDHEGDEGHEYDGGHEKVVDHGRETGIQRVLGHREAFDNELPSAPTVLVFDGDPWSTSRAQTLKAYREQYPNVVTVVLVSSPSPTLVEELRHLGAERIVHKLGFRLDPASGDESPLSVTEVFATVRENRNRSD